MPLGYPDTPRSFANNYADSNVTVESTALGSTMPTSAARSFGFNAALVKVTVDVGTVYLTFGTTGAASTANYKQTSGDLTQTYHDVGIGISGMTFAATSTAAAARIGAWG